MRIPGYNNAIYLIPYLWLFHKCAYHDTRIQVSYDYSINLLYLWLFHRLFRHVHLPGYITHIVSYLWLLHGCAYQDMGYSLIMILTYHICGHLTGHPDACAHQDYFSSLKVQEYFLVLIRFYIYGCSTNVPTKIYLSIALSYLWLLHGSSRHVRPPGYKLGHVYKEIR